MKKLKSIIFTTWYVLAIILVLASPFLFEIITKSIQTLLVLNIVIPAVILITDDEIIDMEIF